MAIQAFCQKYTRAGFQFFLHTTLLASHIKKLETYFALLYFWTFAQCGMKAGNIFSHLCFVYHYVTRNVDMLEKTKQYTLLLSLLPIITILLIFVSNNNMIREVKVNIFQPYQQSQSNKSYINLKKISRRTEIQRTSQNNYNCGQEWTSFIVPYRNRKEHLPLFLKAVTNHEKHNSKQNVSDSIL
jgi:hypothetical protein